MLLQRVAPRLPRKILARLLRVAYTQTSEGVNAAMSPATPAGRGACDGGNCMHAGAKFPQVGGPVQPRLAFQTTPLYSRGVRRAAALILLPAVQALPPAQGSSSVFEGTGVRVEALYSQGATPLQ